MKSIALIVCAGLLTFLVSVSLHSPSDSAFAADSAKNLTATLSARSGTKQATKLMPTGDARRAARASLSARPVVAAGEVVRAIPISLAVENTPDSSPDADNHAASGTSAMRGRAAAIEPSRVQDEQKPSYFRGIARNLLQLGSIELKGNYRLDADEILAAAGLTRALWLWQVDPREIEQKLLNSPWIESVSLDLQPYPARIKIQITEAEPWLIAEYERHSWLVSRKGVLLQTLDTLHDSETILETTELARLDGLDSLPAIETYLSSANARFVFAVKLIRMLQSAGELPFHVERYTLLPNGTVRLMPQQSEFSAATEFLVAAQDFEEAASCVQRLRLVINDLKARNEHPRRVDLRFKNQAIIE